MKEKLVKLSKLDQFTKKEFSTHAFKMHDGKCAFPNDDERVLMLFEFQHTSVMTPCCNFETGRTPTSVFESMKDRLERKYNEYF